MHDFRKSFFIIILHKTDFCSHLNKSKYMAEKIKYELEYPLNTSKNILFTRLSSPGGLSEWFADDVHLNKDIFTFIWERSEQQARLLGKKTNAYIRFQWLDEEDPEAYFEFRITSDELTGDTALVITDFAEDEEEKEDNSELWNSQIDALKHNLGI